MQFHQKVLGLRAYRQEVLASNIANADTPNYKARDFDFKTALKEMSGGSGGKGGQLEMTRTAAGHIKPANAESNPYGVALKYRQETQSSVDGNTVNMDVERAAFAENAVQYEASISFASQLMRKLQSAMQSQ